MATPATASSSPLEPTTTTTTAAATSPHYPTAITQRAPDSKLSRKSMDGELEFLIESLTHPLPMHCTCIEYILSGPEHACLKRRIAKMLSVTYEPARESARCTCGGAWNPSGDEMQEDHLGLPAEMGDLRIEESPPAGTRSGAEYNADIIGGQEDFDIVIINAESDEDEDAEEGHPFDGGSETGATFGVGSDTYKTMAWDGGRTEEAAFCEEHGGKEGNPKGKCDTCRKLYASDGICKEHGGWEGNLKRLCDACKEVYGDPYEWCQDAECIGLSHGGW